MNSMGKAVWYIERHFGRDVTLADVAEVAGLSKFQLARAFDVHAGKPVMRYVRARRLSDAAKPLARDRCGILDVTLKAGYNSHQAFTRGFVDQFRVTPGQLRKPVPVTSKSGYPSANNRPATLIIRPS